MNLFLPNNYVKTIFKITPEMLKLHGIKGMVVDLDNTLVPWNVSDAPQEVSDWIQNMVDSGIQVFIFSNNNRERVKRFAKPLHIPYIYRARKPLKLSFQLVTKKMGISSGQLAVIGDQLLTDILGGNLFGAYTILVVPIVQSDAPVTKFNRLIEKIIMNYFFRTGKLVRSVIDENEPSM